MNKLTYPKVSKKNLINASMVAAAALAFTFPAFASAATYAYVNQAGNVATVMADNPNAAMYSAPNIDEHSGVMLLTNPNDGIVGDYVIVQ